MGRRLKSVLELVKPCQNRQMNSKYFNISSAKNNEQVKQFQVNARVFVKKFAPGPRWLPAVVKGQTGPVSYLVSLENGRQMRRHLDQIRENTSLPVKEIADSVDKSATSYCSDIKLPDCSVGVSSDNSRPSRSSEQHSENEPEGLEREMVGTDEFEAGVEPRRSLRATKKPDRFGDNIYD